MGIDINPRYVEHARRHRTGSYQVGDARKLDLPDDHFDQILIFGVLHHMEGDDARAALAECRRVLAPGGRVLVIEDIPTVSRFNWVGRWLHSADAGDHIRPVEGYRRLFGEIAEIEREDSFRSGVCDYYLAVLAFERGA